MSTNFYLRPHGVTTDDTDEMIHLGKRSLGWTFAFRAYLEPVKVSDRTSMAVTDYASWRDLLEYGTVVDEYGRELTSVEMEENVRTLRRIAVRGRSALAGEFADEDGNRFIPAEFC